MDALLLERRRIEEAMQSEMDVLREAGVPFKGNGQRDLLDAEGFPRSDIDVYAVRVARNRLYRLKTDLEAVHTRLEKAVIDAYQNKAPHSIGNPQPPTRPAPRPFLKVNTVSYGSPSAAAVSRLLTWLGNGAEGQGLHEGDLILAFGTIDSTSSRPMEQLPPFVASHIERDIEIRVERNSKEIILHLVPRPWQGRGLLGCHLLPI